MDPRLEVAVAAAKAGGEVALRYFRTGLTVEYKGDRSPVTRADRECEQCIIEMLHAAFPQYGIVGEEFGERRGGRFTDFTGAATIYGGMAIASNGAVHDEILQLLGTAPVAA